jgi:hypothetical protein
MAQRYGAGRISSDATHRGVISGRLLELVWPLIYDHGFVVPPQGAKEIATGSLPRRSACYLGKVRGSWLRVTAWLSIKGLFVKRFWCNERVLIYLNAADRRQGRRKLPKQ